MVENSFYGFLVVISFGLLIDLVLTGDLVASSTSVFPVYYSTQYYLYFLIVSEACYLFLFLGSIWKYRTDSYLHSLSLKHSRYADILMVPFLVTMFIPIVMIYYYTPNVNSVPEPPIIPYNFYVGTSFELAILCLYLVVGLLIASVASYSLNPSFKTRHRFFRSHSDERGNVFLGLEAGNLLKNFMDFPKLVSHSSTFLLVNLHSYISRTLHREFPKQQFELLNEVFSDVSLTMKIGKPDEKEVVKEFFSAVAKVITFDQEEYKKRAVYLLSLLEDIFTKLQGVEKDRSKFGITGTWNVHWFDHLEHRVGMFSLIGAAIATIAIVIPLI